MLSRIRIIAEFFGGIKVFGGYTLPQIISFMRNLLSGGKKPIDFIVKTIIEEQFQSQKELMGLWAIRYGKYSEKILNIDKNFHMSGTASITCSTTICIDFFDFTESWSDDFNNLKKEMQNSIYEYYRFLEINVGPKGGFGIYQPTSTHLKLVEDLRHTFWGLIFLSRLRQSGTEHDEDCKKLIEGGVGFCIEQLKETKRERERVHTLCSIHRALNDSTLSTILKKEIPEISIDVIEKEILERYRSSDAFWDFKFQMINKKIDDVLDVGKFLNPNEINSSNLKDAIKESIRRVFNDHTIAQEKNRYGIKLFTDDVFPDVGATSVLIDTAIKYSIFDDIKNKERYLAYVRCNYFKSSSEAHNYAWHQSSLLKKSVHDRVFG